MPKQSKTQSSSSQPGTSQDNPGISDPSNQKNESNLSLANHFLIAMPSMLDPVFGGTVVYLCEHNANGALGVIINKPTDMTMDVLLDRIDLKLEIAPNKKQMAEKPVMFGGPVQVERGFVLHTPLGKFSSMIQVAEDVTLTTSKDVLEAVASGNGPSRMLVTLGCAGWSAGQLESEIAKNGWLTVPADSDILFDMPIAQRFAAAIKLLGIDPAMLASEAGHA